MKKRLVCLAMVAVLVGLVGVSPVLAVEAPPAEDMEARVEVNGDIGIKSLSLVMDWESLIKSSGTTAYCNGWTMTYTPVEQIKVTLYLQKYSNGSWSNVTSWSQTAYNTDEVYRSGSKVVTPGFYYRVKGVHYAKEGTSESITSYTPSILIQ